MVTQVFGYILALYLIGNTKSVRDNYTINHHLQAFGSSFFEVVAMNSKRIVVSHAIA